MSANPLAIFHLRGTQAEMGTQLGKGLVKIGGWEPLLDYYPRMPAMLIGSSMPPKVRRLAEPVLRGVLRGPSLTMIHYRRRHFPEYHERSLAMVEALGRPASAATHIAIMDVFQNVVGLATKWGFKESARVGTVAHGMCSSLAVWGEHSSTGGLFHARNFDFPGVGVWDIAPTLVFCTPDKGVRYAYVGARGADVPGITAFNEAGLTITAHTRFHREVHFARTSIVDLAHEIIRRATNLKEALAVAKEHPVASTWGLLVSSAAEKASLLIETTASGVEGFKSTSGRLACTNHYRNTPQQENEASPSATFMKDSLTRHARLEQVSGQGAIGVEDLQRMLGDLSDPDADAYPAWRVVGNNIASPLSVQSIVNASDERVLHVSVGTAPTGWGPYAAIPWNWDAPQGVREISADELPERNPNIQPDAEKREAYMAYTALAREHLVGRPAGDARDLARRWPKEPHFQFMAGITELQAGNFPAASGHFDQALALESAPFRRAQYLLWASRVQSVLQDPRTEATRAALAKLEHPVIADFQKAAAAERKKPLSSRRLTQVSLNWLVVDAE